jgi:hypothetical protein
MPLGAAEPPVEGIPAFIVGCRPVSSYLLKKYLRRYEEEYLREHGVPLIAQERSAWYEQFIAQQTIIAHAEALGYFDRAEVCGVVTKMERNMLTQQVGPFYQQLFTREPRADEEPRALYERSLTFLDCVIVRIANDTDSQRLLGSDFETQPTAVLEKRIEELRNVPGVEVASGWLRWPFFPFTEITRDIEQMEPGKWSTLKSVPFGSYHILVRTTRRMPLGAFESERQVLESFAKYLHENTVIRRHRLELLAKAGLEIDSEALATLELLVQRSQVLNNYISLPDAEPQAGRKLYSYQLGGDLRLVTVAEFVGKVNERFVRRVPRTPTEIWKLVQDLVVEEYDLAEARSLGLDATPQFTEDRAGFAGFQALDLFERENGMPHVAVTSAEIEQYYRDNARLFLRTVRVAGRRLCFGSASAAFEWTRRAPAPATMLTAAPLGVRVEPFELRAGDQFDGAPPQWGEMLMRCKDGAFLPLAPTNEGQVIVVKDRDMESRPIPLDEVVGFIRARLVRHALERERLELARQLRPRYPLTICFVPADYGLIEDQARTNTSDKTN